MKLTKEAHHLMRLFFAFNVSSDQVALIFKVQT